MFRDELRRVFDLIAQYPEVAPERDDVRRILLNTSQHYVYYMVDRAERRIDVVAVWGTSRGSAPAL